MQQQMSQLHDCSHSCSQESWTYTYVQRVTRATVRDQHNLLVKKTATHTHTHTHTHWLRKQPHTHTHTHTAWVRRKKNTQVHLVTGRRYSSKPILQQRTQIEGANAQSRKEGSGNLSSSAAPGSEESPLSLEGEARKPGVMAWGFRWHLSVSSGSFRIVFARPVQS